MSDPTTTTAATVNRPAAGGDDPFQRLHKMSTTAGVGSGEYVAINGTAIAAVVLGVASAIVLGDSWVLLSVPIVGLVCGVVALVQVSRSNGTQTGRGIAALGLILSLGFGGYYVGHTAYTSAHERTDQNEIIGLARGFGADLASGNLHAAYLRCDPKFRQDVSADLFDTTLRPIAAYSPILGNFKGIDWNGVLSYTVDEVTGDRLADGMVFIEYSNTPRPARVPMGFKKVDGHWMIDQMPSIIEPPKPKKATPAKAKVPYGPMPQVG